MIVAGNRGLGVYVFRHADVALKQVEEPGASITIVMYKVKNIMFLQNSLWLQFTVVEQHRLFGLKLINFLL